MKKFEHKKSLGQNFLTNETLIKNIVDNINIDKDTLVIEIGPGMGIMSNIIIPYSKNTLLFEIDNRLKSILDSKLSKYDNYELIIDDFLKVDLKSYIKKYDYNKLYVVANLPYYITTPIVTKLINEVYPDKILIMVQKEVADRFCAKPGSSNYGYITVQLNSYYKIKKVVDVDRSEFDPVPNVDSSVILLEKNIHNIADRTVFNNLLKDCFKFKRKNLNNNLNGYNKELIASVLLKHTMTLENRAEDLSVEIFEEIVCSLEANL